MTNRDMSETGRRVVLLLAVIVTLGVLAVRPAHATPTTFTVNNVWDPGDGVCDATGCTLREAISAANDHRGRDTINFNIPGSGVHTLRPSSELPAITEAVIIDGYSQPGSSPNTLAKGTDAKIMIQLAPWPGAGPDVDGLTVADTRVSFSIGVIESVIRGLAIYDFSRNGIAIEGQDAKGVRIEGNFIGTDSSGSPGLGNARDGVLVSTGTSGNIVGGSSPAARNLISGNGGDGVSLDFGSTTNKVLGNLIGTKKQGTGDLGNADGGVDIQGAPSNSVGGSGSASANIIAFNGNEGVLVWGSGNSAANRVLRNSIFSNGDLGMDLANNGSTTNDAGDIDVGPNGLQNKPAIRSARTSSEKTTIKGRLSSKPNQIYVVRFFSNPSGTDEGKTFIGRKKVSTGDDGKGSFTFVPSKRVVVGKTLTATATGTEGTSEFSAAMIVRDY